MIINYMFKTLIVSPKRSPGRSPDEVDSRSDQAVVSAVLNGQGLLHHSLDRDRGRHRTVPN